MKIKILILLFIQTVGLSSAFAQVVFTEKPINLELISRNLSTNKGTIQISGNILNGKYSKLRVVTFQNKTQLSDISKTYTTSNSVTPFSYTNTLQAGKYHYDFDLYFYGSADTVKYQIKSVVCGDLFIIQGQSNAVANSYYGLANSTYQDSFIRSFGSSDYNASVCESDTNWYIADGDGYYNKGCIGQWGLVMAKQLLDSFQIPVAILNGAVGGTSVYWHQRNNSTPKDLNTIYGRLLYRISKAGMENNVRGIFYFQGESDGLYPIYHDTLFKKLYKSWRTDYKKVTNFYFVQVRDGCGSPSPAFLEIQRQFEFSLSNLKVISANGLNSHDGCHYGFSGGYEQLGHSLAPLVARDMYNSKIKTNIDPPNISHANFTDENNNEIVLTLMQPNDSLYVDNNFWQLFSVTGENGVSISGGKKLKNKITLTLNQSTCKPLYLTYFGYRGSQAWVKNRFGAGLISFDNILVDKTQKQWVYFSCPNAETTIGSDSGNGLSYYWKNLSSNKTYKTAKINIKSAEDIVFEYAVKGVCSTDTNLIELVIDKTDKPNLGNDTTLCPTQTLHFNYLNKYPEVSWFNNNNETKSYSYEVKSKTNLIVKVKTDWGCSLADTVNIAYSNLPLAIQAPDKICSNTETPISCNANFKTYKWNHSDDNDSFVYITGAGTTHLEVKDSFGCVKKDSVTIGLYPVTIYNKPVPRFCLHDSSLMVKPNNMKNWQSENVVLPPTYYFKANSNPSFIFTDSNNCNYADTLEPIVYPLPEFSLGNDTAICADKTIKLVCAPITDKYYWNGKASKDGFFETQKGTVTCQIFNQWQCAYQDTIEVIQIPLPVFSFPSDTTICENDSILFESNSQNKYYINNQFLDRAVLKQSGNYKIEIENEAGCRTAKNIHINTIPCSTQFADRYTDDWLKIFPVPCNGILNLQFAQPQTAEIMITNSLGESVYSIFIENETSHSFELPQTLKGILHICIKTSTTVVNRTLILE